MRWVLAAVASVVVLALPGLVFARPASEGPSRAVFQVDLQVARTGAPQPSLLRFEVVAGSRPEAENEARRVAAEHLPALAVLDPGDVAAQWLPWSWKWEPHEIPVPVAYNPSGAPLAVGPPVIVAGLQAWSNVPTSSFRFSYAGITENTASLLALGPDGENVISWASLDCATGCVLGITSKEAAHEVDMLLNSNPEAAEQLGVGSVVDWRTVVLHELGHVAGLEHSCPVPFGPCTAPEAEAVMYFQYRGILRKLAPDDVEGLTALYPLGGGTAPSPTPPPGATPVPPPPPEFPVLLESGWNLVLLPAGNVSALTGPLGCLTALYSWSGSAWLAWVRSAPQALQTLAALEEGRAYWAHASGACTHTFR